MSVNPDFIGIDGVEFYFTEAKATKHVQLSQPISKPGVMPNTLLPSERQQA